MMLLTSPRCRDGEDVVETIQKVRMHRWIGGEEEKS
jgi:hypothetical protein